MITFPRKTHRGSTWGYENPGDPGQPLAVSSVFGPRVFAAHEPVLGYPYDFHRGIDFAGAVEGDPVYSPTGGVVIRRVYSHLHFGDAAQIDDVQTSGTVTWNGSGDVSVTGTIENPTKILHRGNVDWFIEAKVPALGAAGTAEIQVLDASSTVVASITYDQGTGTLAWTYPLGGSSTPIARPEWIRIEHLSDGDLLLRSSADGDSWTDHHVEANALPDPERLACVFEGADATLEQFNLLDDGVSIGRFGNWVTVQNNAGKAIVMHLSRVFVLAGDVVAPGQQLGTVGKTGVGFPSGRVGTVHAHVEVTDQSVVWAYTNSDARNPLAPGILPRENVSNNVSVTAEDALDPDETPCWAFQITVTREDSDFDLDEITIEGPDATRVIGFNARTGLNANPDIPVENGVFIVPDAFNAASAAYVVTLYLERAVVGTGSFDVTIRDTEGALLYDDSFLLTLPQPFYGNDGGMGTGAAPRYGGGGGGGAGAPGEDAPTTPNNDRGGNGGDGVLLDFDGVATYYAGGGGGGVYNATTPQEFPGEGGLGGGGRGGWLGGVKAGDGTDGLGGGGGGAGTRPAHLGGGSVGGDGGSGVVRVRYLTSGPVDASGGVITIVGAYTLHTFTTPGTLSVSSGGDVEYLIVGGGGGGAGTSASGWGAGGGGAGGVVTNLGFSPLTISAGSYSADVGAGGDGGPDASNYTGFNGGNSSVFGITALGGGGGGGINPSVAQDGGSGGGSSNGRAVGQTIQTGPPEGPTYGPHRYFLSEATVIQANGATIDAETITVPTLTSSSNPNDASAVIYEWPLIDMAGVEMVAGDSGYELSGSIRLLVGGSFDDWGTDLQAYLTIVSRNGTTIVGQVGCILRFDGSSTYTSDATVPGVYVDYGSARVQAFDDQNTGVPNARGAVCFWSWRPNNIVNGGGRINRVVAAPLEGALPGEIPASSALRVAELDLNNGHVFNGDTLALRLSLVRATGAARTDSLPVEVLSTVFREKWP